MAWAASRFHGRVLAYFSGRRTGPGPRRLLAVAVVDSQFRAISGAAVLSQQNHRRYPGPLGNYRVSACRTGAAGAVAWSIPVAFPDLELVYCPIRMGGLFIFSTMKTRHELDRRHASVCLFGELTSHLAVGAFCTTGRLGGIALGF